MVDLGRKARKEPTADALVSSLSRGSSYEQLLSLKTCHGSRNVGVAIHLLSSDSKYLKKQAINLIASLGSDTELLDALRSAPTYLQSQTIRRIRNFSPRRTRMNVIENFLEYLKQDGSNKSLFQNLLPFGSQVTVEKYLPTVINDFALIDWFQLAKCHPDLAQQQLYQLIEQSEEQDALLISTVKTVFTQCKAYSHSSLLFFSRAENLI
jgi:hypothetical protein